MTIISYGGIGAYYTLVAMVTACSVLSVLLLVYGAFALAKQRRQRVLVATGFSFFIGLIPLLGVGWVVLSECFSSPWPNGSSGATWWFVGQVIILGGDLLLRKKALAINGRSGARVGKAASRR